MKLSQKAMEAKARRMAAHFGWTIKKSRAGLSSDNEGGYAIINDYNTFEYGERYGLSIEEVIEILEAELA